MPSDNGALRGAASSRSPFLAGAAVASAISAASLTALAFLPRPFSPMSHYLILTGAQRLSPEQLAGYVGYLEANLTVDSVYLLGHVVTWMGYAVVIARRSSIVAAAVAALGVLSGLLDFAENSIRWSLASAVSEGMVVDPNWGVAWDVVVGLSFWAIFIPAVLASLAIWSRGAVDRAVAVVGLGCALAMLSIYPKGFFLSFIWLIVWHAASAAFLWRRSRVAGPTSAETVESEPGAQARAGR